MENRLLDKICIRDLALRCLLGVDPEERREKQDVLLNITLYADLQPAARSDDFSRTVDYRAIKKEVVKLVENSQFQLVEALAEKVAALCNTFAGVEQVDVCVEKPGALRFARTVAVEITRKRA